jgi:hypothetical protein
MLVTAVIILCTNSAEEYRNHLLELSAGQLLLVFDSPTKSIFARMPATISRAAAEPKY